VIPSAYDCRKFDSYAGFYGSCHAMSGVGKWPQAKTYRQVITTYVKP
jgi:hypothetical protein